MLYIRRALLMSPMLLWLLQCSGHSNEIDVLNIPSLNTVKPGDMSVIFDILPQNVSVQYNKLGNSIIKQKTFEEVNMHRNLGTDTPRPLYQLFKNILSPTEHSEIGEFVKNGGLGHDYTSEHFLERYKNIRYVKVLTEGFEILEKNFFEQDATHNDFSGGYRRYYELIPEQIMMGPMNNLISIFIDNLKIPVGTIFMAVLQSSTIRANVDDHGGDVTGQGIHTDGVEDIMLVCVERNNVQGAVNEFHGALDGTQLLDSAILETGDGVLVQDNKVFHHVTEATTTAPIARRTVIILLTPNDGSPECPENKLGGNDADIKLRHYAKDNSINTKEKSVNFDKLLQSVSIKNVKSDDSSLNNKIFEDPNIERNNGTESLRPLYQLFKNILSPTEHNEIAEFVKNGGLGHDYTSEHFLERYKNIRYVKVLTEGFEILEKNFFEQDATHNDFSGGYRRYYELIPEEIMMGPMNNLISIFIDNLKIPVGTIFMAVLQSSTIRTNMDDHGGDVTGQGIHTDGVEDIMLVCVERDNVQGAVNEFHGALDGTQLLESAILETGDGVLVQDNKVFHHVTEATTTAPIARRTVIILLTPNDGSPECPENKLGGNDADIKLRHYAKDNNINTKEKLVVPHKLPQNVYVQNGKSDNSNLKKETFKELDIEGNNGAETPHPLYQFFNNILSPTEHNGIAEFVKNGGLGHDYTSEHFLERYKNIRYVRVLTEGFEILEKNFFEQDATHNDFSGGYIRYYELIPEQIMIGPMYNLISIFIDNLKIPVGTIFMAVLQSSTIRANVEDHGGDVTGQGIHTDGVEDIMLVCVERDNIQGAVNEFHGALDGTQLLHSAILENGDGVLVKDNKVFHHVTEATTTAPIARRTVIILLTPNDGSPECPENQLGGNDADIKLRHYAKDNTLNTIKYQHY